jgi:hypothetical protein
MYRTRSSKTEHRSTVRAAGPAPFNLLLPTSRRIGPKLGADAADRQALSETPFLRQPTDGRRVEMQSQANTAAHAFDEHRSYLSQEADHSESSGTQDLPVFTAKCGDNAYRPGVEHRHHLHSDATWISVFGCGDRLVQPVRFIVAALEHVAGRILHRGVGGSVDQVAARDLQHRPGGSVHLDDIYIGTKGQRRGDQHGRSRASVGQRVHRTSVAKRQVLRSLPERLPRWLGGRSAVGGLLRFLSKRATASISRLQNAGGGLLVQKLGQNWRTNSLFVNRLQRENKNSPDTGARCRGWRYAWRGPLAAYPNHYLLYTPICCPKNGVHFTQQTSE